MKDIYLKEPWECNSKGQIHCGDFHSGDGATIICKTHHPEHARRIVACVNACQGIEDPEKFIESAKKDKIWHQRAAAFLAEKGLQDQFYQWVDKQQQ